MTTIATDGKTMACDGLVIDNNTVTDTDFRKVIKLADGRIVGGSGSAFDFKIFCDWLSNDIGKLPDIWEKNEFLVLNINGVVELYNYKGYSFVCSSPQAIGSGMDFALAAMDAGLDPVDAVSIAIMRDIHSGGTIFVESII